MLRRVLIRLLWNSSAGDVKVSLTGVSRYVIRALVMSVSLTLFFRICLMVATALSARPHSRPQSSWSFFGWGGRKEKSSGVENGSTITLMVQVWARRLG